MIRNIGLDMDGVIVDFIKPLCEWLEVPEDKITSYKLEEVFPGQSETIRNYYGEQGYFEKLQPYSGALDFLKRITKEFENHARVWFISRPSKYHPYTFSDKIKWIHKYAPYMIDTTVFTQDKNICQLDVLVDDDPDNLKDHNADHLILFKQNWNLDKGEEFHLHSNNYDEIFEYIESSVINNE